MSYVQSLVHVTCFLSELRYLFDALNPGVRTSRLMGGFTTTRWCPPSYKWIIIPLTSSIYHDISTINQFVKWDL